MLSTLEKIHQRCINFLLTDVSKRPLTEPMSEVFYLCQNHYDLCNLNVFVTDNPRKKFIFNSSAYQANQLWQALLSEVKDCYSLQHFKNKIKIWLCDR